MQESMMQNSEQQTKNSAIYAVVLSEEGRAAVWPVARPLPVGWAMTDTTGSREECLAYIQLVGDDPVLRGRVAAPVAVV
ncbi:MAG: MbtH family NRPS accessory protein [Caldilineaceae bacterium]|nr:MbtH family NRPS accessory protein [Caldilineaceae bacterium]